MSRIVALTVLFFVAAPFIKASAQLAPAIEWQRSFGGTVGETANSVVQAPDGGFVFAGYTKSKDGDISGNNGNTDFWVVKMDASGNFLWQQSLGGSDHDAQWDFQLTDDGGYVIAGQSKSNDGDLTSNKGETDYWIVRLDGNGNIVWQRSYGGSAEDEAYGVQQTMDGGFIVAGYTESNDGDVTGNHGELDYWVLKLDGSGNLLWQKCYGGSGEDEAYSISETADGGFVVAGESESTDGDVTGNHGEGDYWIVRLDNMGNLLWEKSFGGSSVDYAKMIKATSDNGYVVAGWSSSIDGDLDENMGYTDYWIVKLDADGNMQWEKCTGGSDYDFAHAISETADGGYVVAGYTHSNDIDVSGNHGSTDYWIIKLDAAGQLSWQKTMGGSKYDQAYAVQQSSDGGFIVAGLSFSNDGDVSGNHTTAIGTTQDCWIVKLAAEVTGLPALPAFAVNVYPNPVQDHLAVTFDAVAKGAFKLNSAETMVQLFDAIGRSVHVPFTILPTAIKFDVQSLREGYYTMRVYDKNSREAIATARFLKQN